MFSQLIQLQSRLQKGRADVLFFVVFLADSVRCRGVFPLDRSVSPLKQQPLLKVH